jgi:hypothetical protein
MPACAWRRRRLVRDQFRSGEGAGQSVNADILWLDVASGFVELAIKLCRFDPAAFADQRAQCRVLTEFAQNVQAAVDQFLERYAIVLSDGSQPPVQFVRFIFRADIESGAGFGERTEPVFSGDVRNIFREFDDALARPAFAGKQTCLIDRHTVPDGPLAIRRRHIVPTRHVEPSKRGPGLWFVGAGRLVAV